MTLPPDSAARKWAAEIDHARRQPAWLDFEAEIHQSAALRARVARALDRFGLGTSDVAVDEALDYLTHKELGASARYFNETGKAQFNQQQLTHAVLSYMSLRKHQRHLVDCALETEADDDAPALDLPDASHLRPDECAARRDAARAIAAMIPADAREVYDLWLAAREAGPRGERGTLRQLRAYAERQGIGLSAVYYRMQKLAETLQRHPWFDELTAHCRPLRRAA